MVAGRQQGVFETIQNVVTTAEPLREKTEELKWEEHKHDAAGVGGAEVGRGCGCRKKVQRAASPRANRFWRDNGPHGAPARPISDGSQPSGRKYISPPCTFRRELRGEGPPLGLVH